MPRRVLIVALAAVFLTALFAVGVAVAGPDGAAVRAQELGAKPFSPEAFAAAKATGKPVLVDVFAPWCPTCRAQRPILLELRKDPKFKDLIILEVDFDTQKEALRALKVQSQSTLIVFRGETERARSVGDTRKPAIEALLDKAL
ncbi:thioredoxin family protein [Xanthobacter sp. KR7-225]|uniref:thioredoxin family protein n=1 Tax=Xanthobacter sp. KR7-225 TaxID=3156613 RepID=UPI0032B587ED